MRTSALISVVVHGGAIGVALATATYAREAEPPPRVEVVALEARPATPMPPRPDALPPVRRERSGPLAELPPDPELLPDEIRQEPEPPVVDYEEPEREKVRLSRVRVVRAAESPPVEPEPPPAEPEPVSVHVAASPFADNLPPRYPDHERALGLEGDVVVGALVDRYGAVVEVRLVKASRHSGFNRLALSAVRKWRFEPATVDRVPVRAEVPVTIEFRLREVSVH